MATTVKTGWLKDKNGDKFAPKTLTSQVQTNDGVLLEDSISAIASGAADDALLEANQYTDGKIALLMNNSSAAVDSIMELATAMKENDEVVGALEEAIGKKANSGDLTSHTTNTTVHITSDERTKWNAAKTHADSDHAPSDAEKNVQSDWNETNTSSDAFIKNKPTIPTIPSLSGGSAATNDATVVGGVTVSGHAVTVGKKTLKAGSNVSITGGPNEITIAATDTKYEVVSTTANGLAPQLDGNTMHFLRGDGQWSSTPIYMSPDATTTKSGYMSASDKRKLNGIDTNANNYTHPDNHPASMITGLATVATSGSYNDLSNKPTVATVKMKIWTTNDMGGT